MEANIANLLITRLIESSSSSSSSDSSSSSESENEFVISQIQNRRMGLLPKQRIKLYMENTVSLYSIQEFKSHFRMTPNTFNEVLRLIGPDISLTTIPSGNKPIEAKKQLLIALWVLATPDSYRSVCEKFDIGLATLVRTLRRISYALYCLAKQIIKWPSEDEAVIISNAFQRKNGFPNIIGAVDGTHVKINAPKEDPNSYINRKGYHSIQLQAVCDNNLKFISTFAGSVGSVHDARVFRNSPLIQNFSNPDRFFPNDGHIIGDAAYPLSRYVMIPYRNNGNLTRRQRNFNFCLSSTRMTIEKAFGLLKCRFRRLLHCLPMKDISKIPQFIISCCVLHNICIDMDDLIEIEDINNEYEEEPIGDHDALRREGELKRNNITQILEIVDDE